MIVFYTEQKDNNALFLRDDEYRHCVKTLRHKVGDILYIFDRSGYVFESQITEIQRDHVKSSILKETPPNSNLLDLHIVMAPTKSPDRIEWALTKCVEVGISSFTLLHTSRTERSRYKLDRLERIAISAAKQSLNFKVPTIYIEEDYSVFFNKNHQGSKLIAHCMDADQHLIKQVKSPNEPIILLIGPEGDFTSEEVQLAVDHGYKEVNLGPTRLRTETAAVVGAAYVQASQYLQSHQ